MNPYTRLKEQFQEYVRACKYRHTKEMWFYEKAKLNIGWSLSDLKERVAAANQIGYDVQLKSEEDGLHVQYIKKIPDAPFGLF